MALNDKQQRFVDEYLKDLNATQAAIRAGYSAKTAYAIAEKLLRKVEIQQAVQDAKKARSERTEITQDRVLQELARLAFFDPRKMFHGDGSPKAIHELDDDTAAAVSGLNVVNIGNSEVGIGQVLKSFRDRPVDFPVCADRSQEFTGLQRLGPLQKPGRNA